MLRFRINHYQMLTYPVAQRWKTAQTVMHDEKSLPEGLHEHQKTNFSLHFISKARTCFAYCMQTTRS